MLGTTTLLFFAVLTGLALVVVGYIKANRNCPPRKVEYRYVPRTFIEDQQEPAPVTDIFAKMFYQKSRWLGFDSLLPPPDEQQKDMNKFFISQS